MNVCLATYQSAVLIRGGPRTQIFETKKCLEELGVRVSLFESWEEFRKEKIDLIHFFGANIGSYHLAREIHRLGVPMVVTPIFFSRHSQLFLRAVVAADSIVRRAARGTWTDFGLVAEICRWAKAVLPNTADEARLIVKGLGIPEEKVTVVHNGVDGRFYSADPINFKNQYGIENFILNVGHVGPERKNVLMLIRALERINVPSVIIGRIEENHYARQCIEEGKKNPRIRILDHIPNDSDLLASAYAACDVFALPSQFETPGIAALEAALAGAKIVITKRGGTQEYFGDHAEYVEPTSVELIHHGIVTALNKKKDTILREHIKQHFLWNRIAEETLSAYKNALGDR